MLLGIVHAVVDMASVAILYGELNRGQLTFDRVCQFILLYNCIAFGLQFPLGLVADHFRAYKPATVAGLAGVAVAIGLLTQHPQLAVVLVGIGNALFHIGAGAIVLESSDGRAAAPGVFVAPGALGVLLGVWLGSAGFPGRLWGIMIVVISTLGALMQPPRSPIRAIVPNSNRSQAGMWLCAGLLFVAIAIRSLIGDAVTGSWRGVWTMGFALTLAAVAGKSFGGFVADRVGRRTCVVGALLLLAPVIGLASGNAPTAVLAMFLIQTTMAVTLTALFVGLPKQPARVFGLASGALLLGALPGLTGISLGHDPTQILTISVIVAALGIFIGLCFLTRPCRASEPAEAEIEPGNGPIFSVTV
jgi:FSR family fosmidomycin resistance protein-like MFS transporter